MPMEREAYRDNLERLKEQFPDKELLRIGEVQKFTGLSYRSVRDRFKEEFKRGKGYISIATLARRLS